MKPQIRSPTALALKSNENVEGSSSLGQSSPNVTMALSKQSSSTGKQTGMETEVQANKVRLKVEFSSGLSCC